MGNYCDYGALVALSSERRTEMHAIAERPRLFLVPPELQSVGLKFDFAISQMTPEQA